MAAGLFETLLFILAGFSRSGEKKWGTGRQNISCGLIASSKFA
jgi:hypothetical protein